jgi:hypothetical protein
MIDFSSRFSGSRYPNIVVQESDELVLGEERINIMADG